MPQTFVADSMQNLQPTYTHLLRILAVVSDPNPNPPTQELILNKYSGTA